MGSQKLVYCQNIRDTEESSNGERRTGNGHNWSICRRLSLIITAGDARTSQHHLSRLLHVTDNTKCYGIFKNLARNFCPGISNR